MSVDSVEKFQRDDRVYLAARQQLAATLGMPDLWSIVDHFALYAGVQTIGTRLAVYEIIKRSLDVPGHIVEFGCWKGANLLFIAKVLQLMQPNTYKHVYGFDSFEGLQTFSPEDGATKELAGQYRGDEERLRTMIQFFGMDEWVHLVKGNALETVPRFEREFPHVMFSLAYVDFDLYQPCKVALEFAWKRLVPGGILVFDEALTHLWPGEGKVLMEFLSERLGGACTVHHIAFARQPTTFVVKQ